VYFKELFLFASVKIILTHCFKNICIVKEIQIMMKPISTLHFLYLYLNCVYLTATSGFPQQATFQIISNSVFIPQLSASFIINLTSNTISNKIKCAEKCLQYDMCQTATYYEDIYTCSLYNQKSSAGQISSAGNSASSVLAMIKREPTSE